jgi:serine/threonine protein kinase
MSRSSRSSYTQSSSPASGGSSDDNEGEDSYKPGGYHRVALGDELGPWKVHQKLGWGHFSTVWLASRTHQARCEFAALKVQKSAPHYLQAAKDEISLLRAVREAAAEDASEPGRAFVVRLLDSFSHLGPNGEHAVMAFEVLGDNLLSLIKHWDYKGMPYPMCRQIAKQVCLGLDYLHRVAGIIHTDLKPENVLIAGLRGSRAVRLQTSLPALGALQLARGMTWLSPGDVSRAKIVALEQALPGLAGAARKKAEKRLRGLRDRLAPEQGPKQASGSLLMEEQDDGAQQHQRQQQKGEEGERGQWRTVPLSAKKPVVRGLQQRQQLEQELTSRCASRECRGGLRARSWSGCPRTSQARCVGGRQTGRHRD